MGIFAAEVIPPHPLAQRQPEQAVQQSKTCHGVQTAGNAPAVFLLIDLDQSVPHSTSHLCTSGHQRDRCRAVAGQMTKIGQ